MALTDEQLQQAAQQYFTSKGVTVPPPKPPPEYAQPKQDFAEQIMPNSDKLTDSERWIYGKMPGWTTWMEENKIAGQSISDRLDKFNNSWVGKGLQYLDVFAEGLERTAGLLIQMRDPNFDFKNLQSAWYAGSLTYATLNLPQVVRATEKVKDPLTGREGYPVVGFKLPSDLPGAGTGLANARAEIQKYIDAGLSPKEALDKARDTYYNGLGALSIRAQMNDLWGHVLLDPLNAVTAWVKPVQALKVRRLQGLNKVVTTSGELITKADDLYKIAKTTDNITDSLAYMDEAYRLAQATGDIELAQKYASELPELAKAAGKIDDITKYSDEITELNRIASNADEVALYKQTALQDLGEKQLTKWDKFAIFATGGDPFRPTKVGQNLRKIPVIGTIGKAFELTPAAKAQELMSLMGDNLGNIAGRMLNKNTGNFAEEFVSQIHRMKRGATGIEYGHAMLTQEGRTIQGFLSAADFDLSTMLQGYQKTSDQRNILKMLSDSLGESPAKLLAKMDENPSAVMDMIIAKIPTNPLLADAINAGKINPDTLKALRRIFPEGTAYTDEMFAAQALDAIETASMRQAVVQFGVEAKGVITRWSDALKAAESLAFLRLSPAYPIRNAVNNEVTMLARGIFGVTDNAGMDDFLKGFGFTPQRLKEAGLSTELIPEKMSEAQKILQQVLDGDSPNKVKEFFQNISLGKFDTAQLSAQFEKTGRKRATVFGMQQYLNRIWKPKKVKEYINPKLMDEINNISPDLERKINNIIRSSGAMDGKLDELIGKNLNVNVDSILDDVTAELGEDIRQVLGDEVLTTLKQKLPEAIESGKLDTFRFEMRQSIDNHVEQLFQRNLDDIVENTKAQTVAGGANLWNAKLAEAQDIFWGAHIESAKRTPEMTALARQAADEGNFALARSLWEAEFQDSQALFSRSFRRVDAYIKGLEQGVEELAKRGANYNVPFKEVRKTFNQWRGMWDEFFTSRNKLYDDFFNAPKDKRGDFNEVRQKMDALFQKNIEKEDIYSQQINDLIANMIDDVDLRQSFTNARDSLSELRRLDKAEVQRMYRDIPELPKEQRQQVWNEFWQQRQARYQQMRDIDAASIMIQQGDGEAAMLFQSSKTGAGGEYNIFNLANQYGIASASEEGVYNNRRILNVVNKYMEEKSITSTIDDIGMGGSGNPQKIIAEGGGINKAEFSDIMGGKLGTDKQGVMPSLFTDKGMGVDEAGRLLAENGLISFDQADDLNFVREFIRNNVSGNQSETFTEVIKYTDVKSIPEDVARQAFEARASEKGIPTDVTPNFIADVKKVVPNLKPMDLMTDQYNYGRVKPALDSIVNRATQASKEPVELLSDLPANLQTEVKRALNLVKSDFSKARYEAVKFGEWRADSALLNYNRRTNFDNWLGHIAPFGFWTTHSGFNWLIESIDRPAMLTNYMRTKKFLETGGMERDGMPSRIKGKIRIELPFAPDWMGEAFIDPLRMMLPFDNWISPFDKMQQEQLSVEGRTQRTLQQMLQEGSITQEDYEQALENRSGATWDYALSVTKQNEEGDKYDAWDFATSLQAPHAPIMWAYNAAFGDKEDIPSFSPLSRIARNTATLLGVEDWNNSKWNLEAKIRRSIGLNSFDKWDNYRIKRTAVNLAGEGLLTPEEMNEVMALESLIEQGQMTPEQAKAQSEAYKIAVNRSNQEYTGGGTAFVLSLLGLSVTSVPEGENNIRALQNDFGNAYAKYKAAEESLDKFLEAHPDMTQEQASDLWEQQNPRLADDADALTKFFTENPEYEGRLALFDKPETVVHNFYVDKIWQTYNELPTINKQEVREHLGTDFQQSFLDRNTRNTDDIPTELMAVWLKMMNVDPLGGLTADQRVLVGLYGKVQFTDPEMAWRVETFYDYRDQNFGEWRDLQNQYYELPPNKRKQFKAQNPELDAYFTWRTNFMRDNPDLTIYLTDNEKAIEEAKKRSRNENSIPTAQEIKIQLPPNIIEILSLSNGGEIPPVVLNELDFIGQQSGLTGEQIYNIYTAGQ